MNFSRLSLLWKIWLSTSVALTALFLATGIYLHRTLQEAAARSLRDEARASAQAYDAMLDARAGMLQSVAGVLSAMPRDAASMRRAAATLEPGTFVEMASSDGVRQMLLAGDEEAAPATAPIVESARAAFPKPSNGFYVHQGVLYQVAVTPMEEGVLVAGFVLNHRFAERLKRVAGNSEFILAARGQIYASTLDDSRTGTAIRSIVLERMPGFASDGTREYVPISRPLVAIDGTPVGQLYVLRPFEEAAGRIAELRRRVAAFWAGAVIAGLALSYLAARRMVRPIQDLDEAAAQVSRQNYDIRVAVDSDDELGRLAATFNKMCESLRGARQELIRRERIGAIARLASSIVHDLRNPLAAIHGSAEILVDTQPNTEQTKRIAGNIHRSSRRIQELMDDLTRVSRGSAAATAPVELAALVKSAVQPLEAAAAAQRVRFEIGQFEGLTVEADPSRLGRVFQNLTQNALEAMPEGGHVRFQASAEGRWAMVEVSDTGPGIPREIRGQLFQPFTSHGKKQGLGLGLALARQTVLDHGGDLWAAPEEGGGARFLIRLPLAGRGLEGKKDPAAECPDILKD